MNIEYTIVFQLFILYTQKCAGNHDLNVNSYFMNVGPDFFESDESAPEAAVKTLIDIRLSKIPNVASNEHNNEHLSETNSSPEIKNSPRVRMLNAESEQNVSSTKNDSEAIANHPNWKYIVGDDEDCGQSNSDRIIGGVDATLGQFPWIAHLGYLEKTGKIIFRCGGTLISHKYVATAAHCLVSDTEINLSVIRLGDHDTKKDIDCVDDVCAAPVQDFKPAKIIPHKKYNQELFSNDVALIRLDRKADFTDWVSPICLPHTNVDDFNKNTVFEVAGWGFVSMRTMNIATVLQTIKLPIISMEKCKLIYAKTMQITERHICAGGILNEDACGGDSGGPLMKVSVDDGFPKYNLVGIVSFGPSDCGNGEPGVYSNVYHYIKWILDNVEP